MIINFSETINKILTILKDHRTYVVGGYLRDYLLDKKSYDIDLAIDAPLDLWLPVLKTHFQKITVFEHYQSVHFSFEMHHFNISRMRFDVICDGRQADIEFTHDLKKDAGRRDFTVNAIYAGSVGDTIDFFNGIEDLKNKHIVFIGKAEERIKQDYLRIFRYFRFVALIDGQIDSNVLDIIKNNLLGIKKMSNERICSEWLKILKEPNINRVFDSMNDCGFHKTIFGRDLDFYETISEIVLKNEIQNILPFPKKYRS